MSKLASYSDIFKYIIAQEANYKKDIPIKGPWRWGMDKHIETAVLYTNSQLLNGKDDFTPVKNIVLPILNLQHRTEDIEVKDVQIYVDDPSKYHLSFLVKKYHDDVFVIENDIETFFDDLNISRIDFGGGLSKRTADGREVVPLESIAFCDQTDILSGPIGIKHFFSPDQLLEMGKVGWGDTANGATITLDELITLSRDEKQEDKDDDIAKTPGRYIEIYEVHGNLPKKFASPTDTSNAYETRIFICAFYQKKETNQMQGVILYSKPEAKSPFKLIKRDKIHGRALGRGGVEELIEPQVWTNYSEKRKIDMIDSASKTILGVTGNNSTTVTQRNKIDEMSNNEMIDLGDSDMKQIDTVPRSLAIFENNQLSWESHAKDLGGAQDPVQGKEPAAGTPFSSLVEQVKQGLGLHDYRRGQYAKHLEEIYYDDYLPLIVKEITKGAQFLSELSLDELQYVTECLVTNESNKRIVNMVLSGGKPTPEDMDVVKQLIRDEFKKKGTKHFVEILAGEFKGITLGVKVDIGGKSRNLSMAADKITSIFRFIFANPQGFAQVMQIPGMGKAFNQLLEFSGLSPADFNGIDKLAISQPPQTGTPTSPAQPAQPQPQYA